VSQAAAPAPGRLIAGSRPAPGSGPGEDRAAQGGGRIASGGRNRVPRPGGAGSDNHIPELLEEVARA